MYRKSYKGGSTDSLNRAQLQMHRKDLSAAYCAQDCPSSVQEFKADKQNKELQKRQSAEINKLQKVKGVLETLKAKADVQ